MSLKETQERRDSVRTRRIITVRHRLVKHKNRQVNGAWQTSVTENMSLSGLLFVAPVAYQVGDHLEVEVVMSGILDIFKGYGEVVRLVRHKAGHYHVAIKYVDLKRPSF